jgi:hypothetical protein
VIRRILAAASPGEVQVALVEGDALLAFALWRPGAPDGVGDCYRARLIARRPALAGSFAALPGTADGFLPDSEGGHALHEGDIFPARITRAAQGGKGPRLTARADDADLADLPPGPPGLVRRGPDPVLRLAAAEPGATVLTDDAGLAARLRPALGARVVWQPDRLLSEALQAQIAELGEPVLTLADGMRLSITPTPALVAIDLDTGAASTAREAKPRQQMRANLAAIPVLARQIRLRNLSGAILVDFAGLAARGRAALAPALAASLAEDPLQPRLLGFTSLGLAEIVRQRVHPPLHELLAGPHAAALAALRALVAARPRAGGKASVWAAPAVLAALQGDPAAVAAAEAQTGIAVVPRCDRALPPLGWRITEDADVRA